jgi:hypothetical protein
VRGITLPKHSPQTHQPAASAAGPPHNGHSALTHPRTPLRDSSEHRTPNTDAPLVLVLSPPWRTVLVLENRPPVPSRLPSRLRGFAASRLRVRLSPHSAAKGRISGWKARATEMAHTRGLPSAARLNAEHRTSNTEHRTPNTEHQTPNTDAPLVLVLSPPWRTVLVLVLENRPPALRAFLRGFLPAFLRGFAASRETHSPQCSKRTDLGLESPSYRKGTHPRTPVRDSPEHRTPNTEHRTPNTEH